MVITWYHHYRVGVSISWFEGLALAVRLRERARFAVAACCKVDVKRM